MPHDDADRWPARIALVITRADLGGGQVHVLHLLREAPAWRRHLVLCGEAGPFLEQAAALGAETAVVPGLARGLDPRRLLVAVPDVVMRLRRFRAQLVHTHTSNAGVVGRLAAAWAGIPAVHTVHGWQFASGNRWPVRLSSWLAEGLLLPLTRRLICVCGADRALAGRAYAMRARCAVVHNGVSGRPVPRRAGDGALRVAMVARMVPQKDHATLLRALARPGLAGITADLWGGGPRMEQLQELAGALGVAGRVRFRGETRDVAAALADADVLVLTSHYEGLPLVLLEGMSAGLALVATSLAGIPEVVHDGWNGRLVGAGDDAAVAAALLAYAADPALVRQHGRRGQALWRRRFTAAAMARRTDQVYRAAR